MEQIPITSCWQSRPETSVQLAQRLRSLLRSLHPITEPFRQWYQGVDDGTFRRIDEDDEWLAECIAAHISRDELGLPSPYFGYNSFTFNTRPVNKGSDSMFVHLQGGGQYINTLDLRPMGDFEANPELVTYPIYKQAILAITRAFEPEWCDAGPFSLWKDMDRSQFKTGPILVPTWMINLSPSIAELVTPPTDVISERGADGSLFMAATDQPFTSENPAHVAAAHRIHAAVDPLHDLVPFNGRMRR